MPWIISGAFVFLYASLTDIITQEWSGMTKFVKSEMSNNIPLFDQELLFLKLKKDKVTQ